MGRGGGVEGLTDHRDGKDPGAVPGEVGGGWQTFRSGDVSGPTVGALGVAGLTPSGGSQRPAVTGRLPALCTPVPSPATARISASGGFPAASLAQGSGVELG